MYFAEIFRYAKRSGGDLMAVIKNTAQIIQQKEEVMSEVDTIISGKKMEQRVMSLIPAVIVIYLKVTAKEFIPKKMNLQQTIAAGVAGFQAELEHYMKLFGSENRW